MQFIDHSWSKLHQQIEECSACPRLNQYCHQIAQKKTKRYQSQEYWGKPVSGFGDHDARLIIVGLAPSAHGANRTGRMFTHDASGEWLYKVLYKFGYSNQPISLNRHDSLQLKNAYITCAVKCAPPLNQPTKEEQENCRTYLNMELQKLTQAQVYIALGKIAFDTMIRTLSFPQTTFAHAKVIQKQQATLIASYHPSPQNTHTKRLTIDMWENIFRMAQSYL